MPGGFSEYWQTATSFGRTQVMDFTFGFEAELQFTFWVALFAVPFQNLTAFGVDQLNAQRMFCCRNAKDASKALMFSCVGQVLTLLMLMVGAALFVHYHISGFTPDEANLVGAAVGEPAHQSLAFVLGKLALGRSLLTRPDAIQAAEAKLSAEAAGRPERDP